MTATEDFFDTDPLERDRYGRPLLVPAAGGDKVPYTRASTMAGYLSDASGLHIWEKRLLAKGLSERPDLTAVGAALPRITGDKKADRPTNAKLDEIIELSLEIGGCHIKANNGTAVHGFCDPSHESGPVPAHLAGDVESFKRLDLDIRMSEVFVANDQLMSAGSFDHIVWLEGIGFVIADIKTGKVKPQDVAVQLAVYAGGEIYDIETNKRTVMPETLNTDVGLLIHIPAGEKRTDLYLVDLVAGLQAARVAAWIRDWRKRSDLLTTHTIASQFIAPWTTAVAS